MVRAVRPREAVEAIGVNWRVPPLTETALPPSPLVVVLTVLTAGPVTLAARVPPVMVVAPVKELAPESVTEAVPLLVRPPASGPVMVAAMLKLTIELLNA